MESIPLRSEWVRTIVDTCQGLLAVDARNPEMLITTIRAAIVRIPPPETPLEAVMLRGLIAEIMLRQLARDGLVAADCANLLTSPAIAVNHGRGSTLLRTHHPKVLLALALMTTSFHKRDLRLKDIASAVQLTPWHLSRLLRREVQVGFAAHLREMRLTHAKALLESPHRSVKEIAAAVGYKYAGDFSRHFARRFGASPNAWRRRRYG